MRDKTDDSLSNVEVQIKAQKRCYGYYGVRRPSRLLIFGLILLTAGAIMLLPAVGAYWDSLKYYELSPPEARGCGGCIPPPTPSYYLSHPMMIFGVILVGIGSLAVGLDRAGAILHTKMA